MGQPLNRCAPVTGIKQCASRLLVLQVESLKETAVNLEKPIYHQSADRR